MGLRRLIRDKRSHVERANEPQPAVPGQATGSRGAELMPGS